MNTEVAESAVLERLVPDLRAQGYDVFVQPSRQLVPPFLGSYRPDVIALRDDKNLVIEIKKGNHASESGLKDLAKRFEGQSRWEFRIVWVSDGDRQDGLSLQTKETIASRLREIRELLEGGFAESALLMCWAALEAIGRKLLDGEFARPQSPGRLVQILAADGRITPSEADKLRIIADKRNRLIHGELTTQASQNEVKGFLKVLESLAEDA